ncbi:helix-turn-helix domain-containing protein [Halodesulfurarchaeum formicicum]|uniref:helix-turn-helix domain-containing protein n=1 Tax=Halodesulfurarchaeum formicicum TaxID=1873524 RepID=UPI000877F460|nr:helix-turn-helix domain-containing protein [Halodesulfurarchaeum formicicum]
MGVHRSAAVPAGSSRSEERELRIVLEIERGGPCSLDDLAGRVLDVDVRLDEETCNVDATVKDDEDDQVRTVFFTDDLCDHCPGKIFAKHDCLPRYRRIDDGSFIMETYASDTDTVAEIVNEVRTISDHVSVKSIVPTDDGEVSEIDIVDLTSLTNKQRRALHYAKEAGYYDSGESVPLDHLAERMGVSTSALSQLLQRAEANVLRQLDCDC